MKKLRLAAVTAVSTLAAGAGLMFPASAQATPTYWTFQNERFGTCLTAGDSGSAYATYCQGWNRQQWDWVGSGHNGYLQLKNRETGRCLMTDNKTNTNAVWMSDCSTGAAGQWWYYDASYKELFNELGTTNDGYLRTSDVKDAVYSTDLGQVDISYYHWTGRTV
ncbi:RICIN domain-containing protein [Streptomyces sp. NK08204]|uniref:RICIN domain-containing protein n=1 Tax=Streptomyces sp. NK08204 TaxID=2873260 RepID=UPI001CED8B19|nr:RICIN domain-containing protein [Streptomyces sp. NK08204]